MIRILEALFFFALCLITIRVKSQDVQYLTSVSMRVPFAPVPIIIDGKQTIYYELHITNFAKDSLHLKKLEVLNRADSSTLFVADSLNKHFARVGITRQENDVVLPAGASGVIYMEVNLPVNKTITDIIHDLSFDLAKVPARVQGASIAVVQQRPLIIGPPLKGGPWWAVYNPLWERGHRRVLYTVNGKARIPGRYAIDFIKVDKLGKYANSNEDSIKNWYGYGADVLAVAGGVVASVKDNFIESSTLSAHVTPSPGNATGNYISIKIGNDQFAFYEHLKPGSIKVTPGQKVKKGDVIASLGFTGQTTGPHLHFHIANADFPLGAEGIPFAFEQFTPIDLKLIQGERPAPNAIIQFDH